MSQIMDPVSLPLCFSPYMLYYLFLVCILPDLDYFTVTSVVPHEHFISR